MLFRSKRLSTPCCLAIPPCTQKMEIRDSDICPLLFIAAMGTATKRWKRAPCPSADEQINRRDADAARTLSGVLARAVPGLSLGGRMPAWVCARSSQLRLRVKSRGRVGIRSNLPRTDHLPEWPHHLQCVPTSRVGGSPRPRQLTLHF